ncbi:class I SAM-dependent DNA methyltransferase [Streptomyces sp. 7R007]
MTTDTPDFIATTRTSYDRIADAYAEEHPDSLAHSPLEAALLTAFADLVKATGSPAPVADLGSGPGYVTARLDALGLPVFGVDLSPRMVELARRAHPGLRFHVGTMTSLDLPAEALSGLVALYSVIHVPDEDLPAAFAEFHRVLAPGGHVLIGFQTGDDDRLHLAERYGREIDLDYYLRTPDTVADHLTKAGLQLTARVLREPLPPETRQRAFLLARKPV